MGADPAAPPADGYRARTRGRPGRLARPTARAVSTARCFRLHQGGRGRRWHHGESRLGRSLPGLADLCGVGARVALSVSGKTVGSRAAAQPHRPPCPTGRSGRRVRGRPSGLRSRPLPRPARLRARAESPGRRLRQDSRLGRSGLGPGGLGPACSGAPRAKAAPTPTAPRARSHGPRTGTVGQPPTPCLPARARKRSAAPRAGEPGPRVEALPRRGGRWAGWLGRSRVGRGRRRTGRAARHALAGRRAALSARGRAPRCGALAGARAPRS